MKTTISFLKISIRRISPPWLIKFRRNYMAARARRDAAKALKVYEGLSAQQVFTKIYEEGHWGQSPNSDQRFFSGRGSHNADIVNTYVEAVSAFLSSFVTKPNIVDLGCGDFTVGSKVRVLCDRYIACDIVESVISWNKQRYVNDDVDFRVLDISHDKLPAGDVVFVRQVLQHMSNRQIEGALSQITDKYKYLILTEHLPATGSFAHNLDKPAGPDIRLRLDSGVVLTSPPFNLAIKQEIKLCEFYDSHLAEGESPKGVIRTTLYQLA